MKQYFIVSLVKNGILGGGMTADGEAVTYHTGKVTIPQEYRHIVMKYEEISKVTEGSFFLLPTVTITLRDGREYTFAVFFGRKHLVDLIKGSNASKADE